MGLKMKTKAKHGFRWGSLRFIGIWVLGYVAAWVTSLAIGMGIASIVTVQSIGVNVFFAMLAIGPTVLQGMVQKWVVRRGLGRDMRGWLRASLIGGVISAVVINAIQVMAERTPNILSGDIGMYVFLTVWLVPAALVQAWWLRKRVQSAWLWAGVGIANALLFTMPMQWNLPSFGGVEYLFMALIALMMGIVSGGIMRYLWTQPQADAAEKAKHEAQADDLAASERLALHDAEEDENTVWQYAAARKTTSTY
jgi:hypothetical protein